MGRYVSISDELILQTEGRRLEFKEKVPAGNNLAKTVIALANDAGGEILIGVRDNPREVIGVSENDLLNIEEQISNIVHNKCTPSILPDISFIKVHGKHIVKVEIYKGNKPPYHLKYISIAEGTYIRVGSSNRLADNDMIEELERQKRNISFDALLIYDKELDKLDYGSFTSMFEEKTGEELNRTLLNKLQLFENYQGKDLPTHALVLLSDDKLRTKLFPHVKIECARFKGTVPGDFIDQKTIDVQVGMQPEQAYQFILRHISQGSEYKGVYRKDRWEYPVIAIREAIRNAVIHRDYSLKGKDIKIAIFDDKIEITSPGKLLPSIDFNDMESGQSDIRNLTLAPVFKRLGIIEQWGNGLRLISEEMKEYPDILLTWSEPGMGFRLTFTNTTYKEAGENATDSDRFQPLETESQDEKRTIADDSGRLRTITDDYGQFDKNETALLIYLLDNKTISRKIAVDLLNLQKTRVHEILSELMDKGFLVRKGEGPATYYTLARREDKG